jgi:ubiquitin C-terminal hydrolase
MSINTYDTTFFNVDVLFNNYLNSRKKEETKAETKEETKAETKEETKDKDLYTPFFHVDVLFNDYFNSRKKEKTEEPEKEAEPKEETKDKDLYTPFFHVDVLFNDYFNSRKKEETEAESKGKPEDKDLYTPIFHVETLLFDNYFNSRKKEETEAESKGKPDDKDLYTPFFHVETLLFDNYFNSRKRENKEKEEKAQDNIKIINDHVDKLCTFKKEILKSKTVSDEKIKEITEFLNGIENINNVIRLLLTALLMSYVFSKVEYDNRTHKKLHDKYILYIHPNRCSGFQEICTSFFQLLSKDKWEKNKKTIPIEVIEEITKFIVKDEYNLNDNEKEIIEKIKRIANDEECNDTPTPNSTNTNTPRKEIVDEDEVDKKVIEILQTHRIDDIKIDIQDIIELNRLINRLQYGPKTYISQLMQGYRRQSILTKAKEPRVPSYQSGGGADDENEEKLDKIIVLLKQLNSKNYIDYELDSIIQELKKLLGSSSNVDTSIPNTITSTTTNKYDIYSVPLPVCNDEGEKCKENKDKLLNRIKLFENLKKLQYMHSRKEISKYPVAINNEKLLEEYIKKSAKIEDTYKNEEQFKKNDEDKFKNLRKFKTINKKGDLIKKYDEIVKEINDNKKHMENPQQLNKYMTTNVSTTSNKSFWENILGMEQFFNMTTMFGTNGNLYKSMYENPNGESNPRHTYEIKEKHTYGTDILRPRDSGDDRDENDNNNDDDENGDGENNNGNLDNKTDRNKNNNDEIQNKRQLKNDKIRKHEEQINESKQNLDLTLYDDTNTSVIPYNKSNIPSNNPVQNISHVALRNSGNQTDHNANRDSGTSTSHVNLEMPNSNQVQKIGHVGLKNLNSTCYLNSTLQSLLHTNILMKYFLDNNNLNEIDGIVEPFSNLAKKMSTANENTSIDPTEFFKYLKNNWETIKKDSKNIQQDAAEVLDFILDQLLTQSQSKFIKSLFYGKEKLLTKCKDTNMNEIKSEDDKSVLYFLRLSFPDKDNDITINDFLIKYKEDEKLTDKLTDPYWNNCKGEITKSISILEPPPILIIQLKRFEFKDKKTSKITKEVDIPLDLDISDYTTNKDENINTKYKLYSVIHHIGENFQSGHYTATIRDVDTDNAKWYKYDDSTVTEVTNAENLFKKDKEAYILFYAREDIKNANIDNGKLVFNTTPSQIP